MQFSRISTTEAATLLEQDNAVALDVRDPQSYQQAHIPDAIFLDNTSIQAFIAETDTSSHLVVYCYHGNTSQQAAAYLAQQGFDNVYSVDGGFEEWKLTQAIENN